MSKEIMQMALEALAYTLDTKHEHFDVDKAQLLSHRAVEHLQQALAQPEQKTVPLADYKKLSQLCTKQGIRLMDLEDEPEQEPVAWLYPDKKIDVIVPSKLPWFDKPIPLYTAPPKRVWQGLTDEERVQAFVDARLELAYMDYDADMKISKVIEAKLKERNT